MKTNKRNLLLLLIVVLNLTAHAQKIINKLNIGFLAAMNINWFTTDEFAKGIGFENSYRISGMFGMSFQKQRANNSSYLVEVLFTCKGGGIKKINPDFYMAQTPVCEKEDDAFNFINYEKNPHI